MEKANVAAVGPFCGVFTQLWAFLHSCVRRRPNSWPFLRSFARCRIKIGFLSVIESPDHRAFSKYG